jgi:hypothetical protein
MNPAMKDVNELMRAVHKFINKYPVPVTITVTVKNGVCDIDLAIPEAI